MSRLSVPLLAKTLAPTGEILLRAELDLKLKDSAGGWGGETFRVDAGAEITSMSAAKAKALSLPIPQAPTLGLTHTTATSQVVTEVRSGVLRFQIVGMDQTEYVIPAHFVGDPNVPFDPAQPAVFPRSLLGLGGVVDKLRFTFDGQPTPQAAHGTLLVKRI